MKADPGVMAAFHGRVGGFALDVALYVPGGVTGLVGPSGSGKTTLLRCLAGLERVPGRLRVDGETWQDEAVFVAPERRRVGYVFQGENLLPHLSVAANLAYAARRAPPDGFALEEVVARTGIAALLDRAPARLSGGEAQRAGLARALMVQPRLLLLDEPLSALDRAARGAMVAMLADLLPALGIAVVYVTHDAEEVERLAARVVRMCEGRVETLDSLP